MSYWHGYPDIHRRWARELARETTGTLIGRLAALRSGYGPDGRQSRVGFEESIAIKWECALRFGQARGWTLTTADFPLQCLRRGTVHAGRPARGESLDRYEGIDDYRYFDHPFCYRIENRAAAIAAHVYGWDDEKAAEAARLAAERGLGFEAPAAPSWWNPDPAWPTTLILWTGLAVVQLRARDERRTAPPRAAQP